MGLCCRVIFLVTLIVTILFVSENLSLHFHGKGVCVARLSVRELRPRAERPVTKWCGRRRCREKKSAQYVTVWRTHAVCCNGWQHNGTLDICEPICSTGCVGGTCVAPDICHCDPPLHLDPKSINHCIPYQCDPPCKNAQCWENNCQCLPDHQRFNSTHCIRCDSGFAISQDFTCKPKCEQTCINSNCIAPNSCSCWAGYSRKNNYTCERVCQCINGLCDETGKCSCFNGYASVNSTHCAPKCLGCENGVCVAPNNCKCREGYSKIHGVCKQTCKETCINGVCIAPGVCSCFEGYQKSDKNPHECLRACTDCKDGCASSSDCNDRKCIASVLPQSHRKRETGRQGDYSTALRRGTSKSRKQRNSCGVLREQQSKVDSKCLASITRDGK